MLHFSLKMNEKINMKRSHKESKLFANLSRLTEQYISGRAYSPMTRTELMKKLSLPTSHKPLYKEVLEDLVSRKVVKLKKNRYSIVEDGIDIIRGVLRLHPRGFGFVQPQDPTTLTQDIFIPKHLAMNAVDGDIVEVKVNLLAVSEKGPEGEIVAIVERSRTHIAGVISKIEHGDTSIAYVPILGQDRRVLVQDCEWGELRVGDRVVLEVVDWGEKGGETICRATHHLGHITDPSCDIQAAIEEFEIRQDFPSKAVAEAKKFGEKIPEAEIKKREDFRKLESVTIDPDTAKDFDDALTLTKDRKGNYHLGVHIADVAYYVSPGTALDEEAKARANSTYFPGTCVPMLPPELSENLCSLRPNVERLTASVMMTFDKQGNLLDYRMARSVIKSKKRFTYKEAKDVLDGKVENPYSKTLQRMVDLCLLLKKKRYERGSIEFSIPDLVVMVDENGNPKGTDRIEYDITHQMVEEFMLKANELVAEHLSKHGKPVTYRVHEEPSPDSLREFTQLATAFGFKLPNNPTPHEFQEFFDEALKTTFGQYLATNYIRRMRLAIYSPENIGHYGLGLEHYCHFTSPIRRYIDLIVHRILFGEDLSMEKLTAISKHCSETERISEKAENRVVLMKKLRLLENLTKNEPYKQFDAVVTRVKPFGIAFEIADLMLESFLHVSELEQDYFVYDADKQHLKGNRTSITYFAGDVIQVMLKNIDLIFLETSWNIVPTKVRKKKRRR